MNTNLKEWIKSILLLPFNAVITIPVLLLYFSHYHNFSYDLSRIFNGVILLIFGLCFAIWSMIIFNNHGNGTLAPWNPPKKIVVTGPYKYVRNPMLLGILLTIAGESITLDADIIFLWFIFFLIINSFYFKFVEEKQLKKRFGQDYLYYQEDVPMWLPKIFNLKK